MYDTTMETESSGEMARGRMARLPNGQLGEVLGHEGDDLFLVIIETGRRETINRMRVEWECWK